MANEIIPYMEMCRREGVSLQRGMNFGLGGNHSVILMSVRAGAPYDDRLEDDGTTLIYEGHDEPKTRGGPDPKSIDQPEFSGFGRPTQNGLFHQAAQNHQHGSRSPERVRVYEKIRQGIWSYNGVFHLVDSWTERSGGRHVFVQVGRCRRRRGLLPVAPASARTSPRDSDGGEARSLETGRREVP